MERADTGLVAYRWLEFAPLAAPGALDELRREVLRQGPVATVICHRSQAAALQAGLPGLPVVAELRTAGPLPNTVWVA